MNDSYESAVDGASRSGNRIETLTIEETVDGFVWAEGLTVTVAATATVIGNIYARQIIVFGTVSGTLEASERLELRYGCRVTGQVFAAKLIVADGASFSGTAMPSEPEQLAALLSREPIPGAWRAVERRVARQHLN
jgi:cytoskeletal protein CcmA (bactofilin family)